MIGHGIAYPLIAKFLSGLFPMRLKAERIRDAKIWLSDWRNLMDFASYVACILNETGSDNFFNQAGLAFLRDASSASDFAVLAKRDFVRLVSGDRQWPDFETKAHHEIELFEVVEADLPNRRRGDEYKGIIDPKGDQMPIIEEYSWEEQRADADKIPETLQHAIQKKIDKKYNGRCSLLIHLNVHTLGVPGREIEKQMVAILPLALKSFDRAWVLFPDRLYGPWINSNI